MDLNSNGKSLKIHNSLPNNNNKPLKLQKLR